MDQIYNQIAKFRYMFGGKTTCPLVIRMAMGAGMNMGPQHSQTHLFAADGGARSQSRHSVQRL